MKYNPALDGLRALAVVFVMLFHTPSRLSVYHATHNWALGLINCGWIGVDMFFVLSGYLITRILLANRAAPPGQYFKTFYVRRMLRIFPLYYVVVPAVLLALTFSVANKPTLTDWISSLTYTQNNLWPVFSTTLMPTLGHTWTLAVEEQFYLVWPLIVYFTPRKYLPSVIIAGIAAIMSIRLFPELFLGAGKWIHLVPPRLDSLLIGSGLALAAYARRLSFGPGWACLGISSVVILLTGNLSSTPAQAIVFNDNIGLTLTSLASASLIVFCESTRSTSWLAHPALVRIGKISYGVYLLHLPVFSLLSRMLGSRLENFSYPTAFVLFFLGASAITFCAAHLSYEFFEKPILSLKERFLYSPAPRASPLPQASTAGS